MGLIQSNSELIESPCIGVCTLDERGFCMGCRRSASEIAGWLEMPTELRQELMAELRSRPQFS